MGTTQSSGRQEGVFRSQSGNPPSATTGGDEEDNQSMQHTAGMGEVYSPHTINPKFGSNYSIQNALAEENQDPNARANKQTPDVNFSTDPIRPELLLAEINGEIAESDYFARAMKILQNIQIDNIEFYKPEDAIELDHAYLLAEPGYLTVENGIVRKPDGSLYIAIFVDLGFDVNGDMFDWWFCNCDNNEKYRWMHPLNHQAGTWDPAYYSMMNFERLRGHYVDHIHITQQYLPSFSPSFQADPNARPPESLYSIQTEFIRPSKFFDMDKFEDQNITSCLVGKINLKDAFFNTYLHIGYVFYLVREINGRSELRIRYFLGDQFFYSLETSESYYYSQMIHFLTNNYFYRMMKLSIGMGKSIYQNCLEEMLCLKEFLPHYYQATLQQQREFQSTYSFH